MPGPRCGGEVNYTAPIRDPPSPTCAADGGPTVGVARAFDVLVPEQVIKVPKMSTPTRCPRTVLSVPQTAEQLVEAPTIVSLIDVIRHPVEQTIGGGSGGLPGFSPRTMLFPFCGADRRQSSSSFSSWFWWRSSRFTPRTEFYSVW